MKALALIALTLAFAGCRVENDPTTTSTQVAMVDLEIAKIRAEEVVASWHDDWRPFVYAYEADCPENQPAESGYRFTCSVEITAHVSGHPETGGLSYPQTVHVLIEVINPMGQMIAEVPDS